jgi:hypothetical protein
MILLEQFQKLIRMPPLGFVVILDYEGPVGGSGCGLGVGKDREGDGAEQ